MYNIDFPPFAAVIFALVPLLLHCSTLWCQCPTVHLSAIFVWPIVQFYCLRWTICPICPQFGLLHCYCLLLLSTMLQLFVAIVCSCIAIRLKYVPILCLIIIIVFFSCTCYGFALQWTSVSIFDSTGQKSHYQPGNHHASHFLKCPISRS